MIRYSVDSCYGKVIVSLNVNSPNEYAKLKYAGERKARAVVRKWIESEHGAFGHIVGDTTTAIDLDCAMHMANPEFFRTQILEGEELVQVYDPGIPEGAVT